MISSLNGFGGFGPSVGAAVVVVLVFGVEWLSNQNDPDTSVLGLDDGESWATGQEGMEGVGTECLR